MSASFKETKRKTLLTITTDDYVQLWFTLKISGNHPDLVEQIEDAWSDLHIDSDNPDFKLEQMLKEGSRKELEASTTTISKTGGLALLDQFIADFNLDPANIYAQFSIRVHKDSAKRIYQTLKVVDKKIYHDQKYHYLKDDVETHVTSNWEVIMWKDNETDWVVELPHVLPDYAEYLKLKANFVKPQGA